MKFDVEDFDPSKLEKDFEDHDVETKFNTDGKVFSFFFLYMNIIFIVINPFSLLKIVLFLSTVRYSLLVAMIVTGGFFLVTVVPRNLMC